MAAGDYKDASKENRFTEPFCGERREHSHVGFAPMRLPTSEMLDMKEVKAPPVGLEGIRLALVLRGNYGVDIWESNCETNCGRRSPNSRGNCVAAKGA